MAASETMVELGEDKSMLESSLRKESMSIETGERWFVLYSSLCHVVERGLPPPCCTGQSKRLRPVWYLFLF